MSACDSSVVAIWLIENLPHHGFDLGGFDVIVENAEWRVVAVKDRFVVFENQSLGQALELTVTWKPFDTVDEVIAQITSHPTVAEFTEPELASVGGYEGVVVFDVTVPEPETPPAMVGQDSGCTSPVLAQEGALGEVPRQSELLGCAVNRVWIAEVDGRSVVIHAGDESGEVRGGFIAPLDEVLPLIDEFLAAIAFIP